MQGSAFLRGTFASLTVLAVFSLSLATSGCAGVKQMATPTGGGGQGGSNLPPPVSVPDIPGLGGLEVTPPTHMLVLTPTGMNGTLNATVQLTATGSVNGASVDLTNRVRWTGNLAGANVSLGGLVTISAPGVFTISAAARNGQTEYTDTAVITATFTGDIFGDGFNQTNNNKAVLDGAAAGSAQLLYPLNESLFPPNLSPIHAHIQATGAQIARLNFQQGCESANGCTVNVNFYANCETGPGGGCYVRMPPTLTRLFIASSEIDDIQLRARASNGGAPAETEMVRVAWANVPLSGGLYYWSVIPQSLAPKCPAPPLPNPPNYCLLDTEATTVEGTAVYRYAFTVDGSDPTPLQVWTDDGGLNSDPPYQGSAAAVNNNVVKGHCIGCHSISNDGKYMTLTIGGSAADAANFALLDIGMQTLLNINPTAGNDPNATPLQNPVEYWKKYRMEQFATESAWGPNSDRIVSMFQSKLFLNTVSVNGTTATAARVSPTQILPSWTEPYATDPFWSQDGTLFVFTSFAQPSFGIYNTSGLNGDMKKGGQIVIADANAEGIMDNARVLVSRGNNVTLGYPAISSDSKVVVFNESTCLAPGDDTDPYRPNTPQTQYGKQSCDGYDDSTAKLWIVKPTGGASTLLARANGSGNLSNSWPRFSPDKGTFRGRDLYWVAFSSRRAYGSQVNTAGPASAKPQLWIAGLVQGGEFPPPDPSFSPVWLPAQNPNQNAPNGNHVPQWVKVAVVIVD